MKTHKNLEEFKDYFFPIKQEEYENVLIKEYTKEEVEQIKNRTLLIENNRLNEITGKIIYKIPVGNLSANKTENLLKKFIKLFRNGKSKD